MTAVRLLLALMLQLGAGSFSVVAAWLFAPWPCALLVSVVLLPVTVAGACVILDR